MDVGSFFGLSDYHILMVAVGAAIFASHWLPRLAFPRAASRSAPSMTSSARASCSRREELQTLIEDTDEEPVLLHPNMAQHYRLQVARLTDILNAEENRAEAADIIRSLVDRIELTPNAEGKLEIDLYGDLAVILTLAANKDAPLDESDASVRQVKVVAGAGFEPATFRL